MSMETFNRITEQDYNETVREIYALKPKFYEKFPIMEATKESSEKMCSICLQHYKKGNQVFFLPCHHDFHIECVLPWFK